MFSKIKHMVRQRFPFHRSPSEPSVSQGRRRDIRPKAAVHTSILCQMRMNKQYRPFNLVPGNNVGEWVILRKQGDPVEECYVWKIWPNGPHHLYGWYKFKIYFSSNYKIQQIRQISGISCKRLAWGTKCMNWVIPWNWGSDFSQDKAHTYFGVQTKTASLQHQCQAWHNSAALSHIGLGL